MNTEPLPGDIPIKSQLIPIPHPLRVDPPAFRGYCCTWVGEDGACVSLIAPTAELAASFYEFHTGRVADMSKIQDVVVGSSHKSHILSK